MILGIDEVGRGAWAGPLAVGAVVFDDNLLTRHPEPALSSRAQSRNLSLNPNELKDSKKLTKKQREKLALDIKKSAVAIGVGWVDAPTIDKIGLSKALKLATARAVAQIPPDIYEKLSQIIVDGTMQLVDDPRAITLVKADAKIAAVSAAAIVAKVARDHYMTRLDAAFPRHEFSRHVGYGTALHLQCLNDFGAIDGVHRCSFAPVKRFCHPAASSRHPELVSGSSKKTLDSEYPEKSKISRGFQNDRERKNDNKGSFREQLGRASRELGYIAETVAADHLSREGHLILVRNWRTKICEIDIISKKAETLYFTEVKFRENAAHGDGLAAITPTKLKQMRRAAELFLAQRHEFTDNFDIQLAAIALSNNPPQVDDFIENIF